MKFQTSQLNRKILSSILKKLTPEQLYVIPKGFNNNIIWNIGHILVTEQLLSYKLSGLDLPIDSKFVTMYSKDSQPTTTVNKKDINDVIQLLDVSKKTENDYKKGGVFKQYYSYKTSIDIELTSIEEALEFNIFHEGIHLGIILSLQKIV